MLSKEIIKFIRLRDDLSRGEFAQKVGISRPLVSAIELGERRITSQTKNKIYRAFGLDDQKIIEIDRFIKRL
ncbi:helix-turn-helix transcriptional regulator [Evansella halocellulosilytica]|uniref:helix-turn-helix transcriptional regulator n=1 Tax=Evansella halocellulosilytica TaxID=2011013 RepID=UPI0015CC617B|nr:helix-turn-helix transcriptional regulator [Evansella halocellulosilytica]